jgi:hypothetical protein
MKEDIQHVWSNEDILAARPDLIKGPILSGFITLTKNKRLEPVIFDIPTPSPPPPPPPPLHPTPPPDLRTSTEAPGANGTLPPAPPPPPQPYPNNPQFPSTARLIGEVAKIYTKEQKYNGSNSNFDHKLTIFLDICQRVELPQEALMRAFPTMLKELAQDHFYSNQLSQRTYEEACINVRSFFEGPGFERRNLVMWNATTLASVTTKFPEKTTFETIQLLINELRQLQYGLTPNLRTTEFLHNKIITSCQGSRACRYAISDPPANLGQLINKLQSSITTYKSEQQANPETFFTNRRYHSQNPPSYRSSGNRQYEPSRNFGTRNDYSKPRNRNDYAPKSCFICKKPEYRSWKHTPEE